MTAIELLVIIGIPTLAVTAMCVVDHVRGRFTTSPDPLADLARRLEQGVVD